VRGYYRVFNLFLLNFFSFGIFAEWKGACSLFSVDVDCEVVTGFRQLHLQAVLDG
jgi:hypothetical protein